MVLSDSGSDTDKETEIDTVMARAAGTHHYVGIAIDNSKSSPVEATDLFNMIFDELYEQYQKGYTTEEIDQLST